MKDQNQSITAVPGCALISGVAHLEGGFHFTIDVPEDVPASLLLYNKGEDQPFLELPFSPEYRFGRICAMLVKGLDCDAHEYNFCIDGKVTQDPMAFVIRGREEFGAPWPGSPHGIRCGLLPQNDWAWLEDSCPDITFENMVLYKLHVRGYTRLASGRARHKGTFTGLIEMIPYWQELGINAIELMPAYEFPEVSRPRESSGMMTRISKDENQVNYWGYTKGCYFAPKRAYCSTDNPEGEVRELVRALHKAGIACIMEFYFPEGICASQALKALQFWRLHYHIDGFHIHGDGAPVDLILGDGILSGCLILVPGCDFGRYKGRKKRLAAANLGFMQDMRRFLKSDEGMLETAVFHMKDNPEDHGVIHFMTCQDGFTLMDLVSYDYRHNEANGQNNQDGSSFNYSWNCGAEGPTRKAAVRKTRDKQLRNAVLFMLLSQGTPMIYAGDEFGNSQEGNNNAWCQDNAIGWVDWKAFRRNQKLFEFVKSAIAFRREHPILHMPGPLKGTDYRALGFPDLSVHGERAFYVSYDNTSRMFGLLYNGAYAEEIAGDGKEAGVLKPSDFLYIGFNFHWENRSLALPDLPEKWVWTKIADTANPEGFIASPRGSFKKSIEVGPRSIVILSGEKK